MKRPIPLQDRCIEKTHLDCSTSGQLWGKHGRLWSENHARCNAAISAGGFIGKVTVSGTFNHNTEADTIAVRLNPHIVLALADKRGALFLIDLEGNRYARLKPPGKRIALLHFSKYATNSLLIGRVDGSIEHYNVKTRTTFRHHTGRHKHELLDIDSSHESNTHLTCSKDLVVLWNVVTSETKLRASSAGHLFLRGRLLDDEASAFVTLDAGWNLNIRCTKSGNLLKEYHLGCISDVTKSCLLTKQRQEMNPRVIVLQTPTNLLNVDVARGKTQVLSLPEEGHGDVAVDMHLTLDDILVVCRKHTCLIVDVKDWKILSQLFFEEWESGPFIGKSVACEGNLITVLSETGTTLLFNLSQVLSSLRHEQDKLQARDLVVSRNDKRGRDPPQQTVEAEISPLCQKQLNKLVLLHGEYPSKYRRMVWTKLLQLPSNTLAFQELNSRTLPDCLVDTFFCLQSQQQGSKRSRNLRQQSRALCSLVKWNGVFLKLAFIEDFIRPFVKLFSCDDQTTFEAIATVLGNWGHTLIDSYPKPPWGLLTRLGALLKYHEPRLHQTLEAENCLHVVLWELLSTGLSKVLNHEDWSMAWDHILSSDTSFLYYLKVAITCCLQKQLKIAVAGGKASTKLLLSVPVEVDMDVILNRAYEIMESTPECLQLSNKAFQPLGTKAGSYMDYFNSIQLSSEHSVQEIIETEKSIARQKRIHQELQEQTIALEQCLEHRSRTLETGVGDFTQITVLKEEDVLESVLKAKKKDFRSLQDRSREQKLGHLKIMNCILKQQEKTKQANVFSAQKIRIDQNQQKLKEVDERYRSILLETEIDHLTRELEKRLLATLRNQDIASNPSTRKLHSSGPASLEKEASVIQSGLIEDDGSSKSSLINSNQSSRVSLKDFLVEDASTSQSESSLLRLKQELLEHTSTNNSTPLSR